MKYLLLSTVLIACLSASAQVSIINKDVADQDSLILFSSFLNHVVVKGTKHIHDMRLSAENAMVSRIGTDIFLVKPNNSNNVTLTILDVDAGKPKKILSKVFSIEPIGDTSVNLIRKNDTVYSNGQRINKSSLDVYFTNPHFKGYYEVAHFEVSVKDNDGHFVISNQFISGHFLSIAITDLLTKLNSGSLLFDHIILKDEEEYYTQYKPLTINF